MTCLFLTRKIKEYILKHHWKLVNLLCCIAFTWQVSGIIQEWINPSRQTTQISEKNYNEMEFPLIIKLCPDPAFNLSALQEEGYARIGDYFKGYSRYNRSILGWAGHTNESQIRGSVDQVYQKIQNFPTPTTFLKW